MGQRLMQSAMQVPLEAKYNANQLDKKRLESIVSKVEDILDMKAEKSTAGLATSRKKAISIVRDKLEYKLKQSILGLYRYKQTNLRRLTGSLNKAPSSNVEDENNDASLELDDDDDKNESSKQLSNREGSIISQPLNSGKEPSLQINTKSKAALNRALLPFYTLADVESFIQIFLKVDENFSGELNITEWIRLFSTMHRNVSEIEARKIFYKIDKNSDGLIQLQELIPIIFPKADKTQIKLIVKEANSYFSEVEYKVPLLRSDEVDELFNCYDFNKTNYVLVGYIRERVRLMQLRERVSYEFYESFAAVKDDDMVNRNEFAKILKAYISKQ